MGRLSSHMLQEVLLFPNYLLILANFIGVIFETKVKISD